MSNSPAYQRFLDYFSGASRERLDGLSEAHFCDLTPTERDNAYSYLEGLVLKGGSKESVNGLLVANSSRAVGLLTKMLLEGSLRPEAEICAARQLWELDRTFDISRHITKYYRSEDRRLRADALHVTPIESPTRELVGCLEATVLSETDELAKIRAAGKLVRCHGVAFSTSPDCDYFFYYRPLVSDDRDRQMRAIAMLNEDHPIDFA